MTIHYNRTIIDRYGTRRLADVRLTGIDKWGNPTGRAKVRGSLSEEKVVLDGLDWRSKRYVSKKSLRY